MSRATDFNLNRNLIFSLPMFEGVGSSSLLDGAPKHHPVIMDHSPTWTTLSSGLQVLDFDGASDRLYCAAASCTDLDFSSDMITWAVWANLDTFTNYPRFMAKADPGWKFGVYADSGGNARCPFLYLSDGSGHSKEFVSSISVPYTTWTLIMATRYTRLPTRIYFSVNGVPAVCTDTWSDYDMGASARDFEICSEVGSRWINGRIWNPRIWRRILYPAEHMQIFNSERELFGV